MRWGLTFWVVVMLVGCRMGHGTVQSLPHAGSKVQSREGPPLPDVPRVERSALAVVVVPPKPEFKHVVVTNDVDPSNGTAGFANVPTVLLMSTNQGRSWAEVARVWGTNCLGYWRWKTNPPGWFKAEWRVTEAK